MDIQLRTKQLAKLSLVLTFVVIAAGSIVRMTGSGMGCPDWPKCFGYLIPPTDVSALTYESGRVYGAGQMVLRNDTLWVANADMSASGPFNRSQWYKYPKHDYAVFNAWHTWVEYVNRLATVVYGIPVFLLTISSLLLWIKQGRRSIFLLSVATLLMVGFEAWLGKLVVDGNLIEHSITYHMFGSVALVALLGMMVFRLTENGLASAVSPALRHATFILAILLFVQILLGTQVREHIDIIARADADRKQWIDQLPFIFKIHRSFSILLFLLGLWVYRRMKTEVHIAQIGYGFFVMCGSLLTGIILAYFSMPAVAQPLHLLLGVLCFALTYYGLLRMYFNRC